MVGATNGMKGNGMNVCHECGGSIPDGREFVCIIGTVLCPKCQDRQRRFDLNELMQSLRPW